METGQYKAAVVYYSLDGNTKKVAEYISRKFSLDIIEIISDKNYGKNSFQKYVVGVCDVINKSTPLINDINLDGYDFILLGSPVWVGTCAPPVRSLINSGKLNGKKIGFFFTHSGSAMHAEEKIEKFNLDIISMLLMPNVKKNNSDLKPLVINWMLDIKSKFNLSE